MILLNRIVSLTYCCAKLKSRSRNAPAGATVAKHTANSAIPLNQSVEKALAVLRAFGGDRRALNLEEIARSAAITKSSAQRITHTLEHLGYVQRDGHAKRWVLSARVLTIGYGYLSGHAL